MTLAENKGIHYISTATGNKIDIRISCINTHKTEQLQQTIK